MRRRLPCLVLLSLAAVGCTAVPAPDLAPPGPASAGAALRRERGREVRLHLLRGDELRGRLSELATDSAWVTTPAGASAVALADVDTVWVHRDPSRTVGRGALLGVAVGAAVAILAFAADCSQCDDPGLGRAVAPYLFGLAATAGALAGSAGAALAPEWSRAFPAVRSPRPW